MIELNARARSRRLDEIHMSETTKAAAWAVFQHHGGSTNYIRSCGIGVRRATRFKIEAQMKNGGHSELSHAAVANSSMCATVKNQWDAGSTLFDSYELDSLSKQFDRAFFLPSHSPELPAELDSTNDAQTNNSVDRTRMTSPFSRHQSHRDARVLPSERMRDSVEDSYTLEHPSFQSGAAKPIMLPPAVSIAENTAYRDEEPTIDGKIATAKSPGRSSGCMEKSVEEIQSSLKVPGLGVHEVQEPGFQFGHTPNPLNLSQRLWRRSVDKSQVSDIGSRQSFQEKLRSFFHKARISPQDSPHKDSKMRGRKSYTGPENSSTSHHGWSFVDDQQHNHTPDESDELLYKSHHHHKLSRSVRKGRTDKKLDASDPAVATTATTTTTTSPACDSHKPGSKPKKSGSFSLRSVVSQALYSSLPHFRGGGGSESPRHRHSNVTEHEHHHIYHHHHVVIRQQQQQQQLEDYELKVEDIDRRLPRKTFEEQARRISFQDQK